MLFIKDPDARPVSAAHPLASVWDVPGDPIAMLRHEIEVRRIALEHSGCAISPSRAVVVAGRETGSTVSPPPLSGRRGRESIGGIDYTYAVKENGAIVPPQVRDRLA